MKVNKQEATPFLDAPLAVHLNNLTTIEMETVELLCRVSDLLNPAARPDMVPEPPVDGVVSHAALAVLKAQQVHALGLRIAEMLGLENP